MSAAVLACASTVGMKAHAGPETIFATDGPGGPFGFIGFDIFTQQSVAARFEPGANYTLDRVAIWFMSNDFDGTTPQTVTVTLRTDIDPPGEYVSAPSDTVLERWIIDVPVIGWNPLLQTLDSVVRPTLNNDERYWLVTESNIGPGINPIWVWSAQGNEFTATNQGAGTPWQSGSGAAVGVQVLGTPVTECRADVNNDGLVNSEDFFHFLTPFFAGDPSADFNGDTVVNSQDFFEFMSAFFAGC